MHVQLAAAQQSLQGMASGFIHRLPYMGLAVLAYLLFHFVARGLRALIMLIAEKREAAMQSRVTRTTPSSARDARPIAGSLSEMRCQALQYSLRISAKGDQE